MDCRVDGIRTYNAARAFCIPLTTGNIMFDCEFGVLDGRYCTYRGIDFQSIGGGSTNNVIHRLSIRGQGINQRTNMHVPAIFKQINLHIDGFNIEHCRPFALSGNGDGFANNGVVGLSAAYVSVNQMHFEGIEPVGNNKALVFAQSDCDWQCGRTEMHDPFLRSANGVTDFYLGSLYGTGANIETGHIAIGYTGSAGNGIIDSGCAFKLGYSSAAVTRGRMEIGRIHRNDSILTYVSSILTNDRRVLRSVDGILRRRVYVAGRAYGSDCDANVGFVPTAGRIYAHLVEITEPLTISDLQMYASTGQAGAQAIVGIYNFNGTNTPGNLLYGGSAFNTSSSGVCGVSGLSQVIMPGYYWFASIHYGSGTLATMSAISQSVANWQNQILGGADAQHINASGNAISGVYADVTVSNWSTYALPPAFPSATVNATSATPRVEFKASSVVG